MRTSFAAVATALALLAVTAPRASAQTFADLVATLRAGGGWVSIPIEDGEGQLVTRAVPTGGMTLAGCVQVWSGHSGRWELDATDLRAERTLEMRARAGQSVPFSHKTGPMAQLDLKVRWSEPRDTTLMVWVGLEGMGSREPERDACEPVYGGG